MKSLSRVRLVVTPWTAAYQAPPSMGFSRQEYWSGVPLPSPLRRTPIPKCTYQTLTPQFDSWVGEIPWRRDRLLTPVFLGFPDGSDGKESACNEGDLGLIPELGKSPGGGHGSPLQYSCQNSMERGAWQATTHGVTKNRTGMSD